MAKDRTKGTGKKCPPGCQCGKHKRHVRPEVRGRKLSPEHKEKLRQANLGRKMPEAEKQKISEGQIRRYRRGEKEMPYKLPEKKRCSKCKKNKVVETSFSVRPRKIKSGDTRLYADAECKKCVAERTKKWRERKRAEGTLAEIQKRYREDITDEQRDRRREYNREYQAIKRREKGMKPRKTLRRLKDRKVERMPIVKLVEKEMKRVGWTRSEVAHRAGIDPSRLDRIMNGEEKTKKTKSGIVKIKVVGLDIVDKLLHALDRHEELTMLYPE